MTNCMEFIGINNVAGLRTKVFEFNESVEEKYKLNNNEKAHLERYQRFNSELFHCLKMKKLITSGLSILKN